jgi:CBS domain containing-hemolysin-like protein
MPNITLDLLRLIAVPVLVVLNGFFVAAEFALVKIRWTKVEELVDQKRFGAEAVREAVEKLDDAIASTQLGITIASLALGWLGEPALAHLIEPVLEALHVPWSAAVAHGIAVAIAFFLITYFHVVLGELAPKAIALQRPENVALWTAGPLLTFGRIFRPFIRLVGGTGRWIVRQLRLPPISDEATVHSVEELQMLVEETEEAGIIPADQATYVQNVFELTEKTVGDIMVPREKVVTLSLRMSPEQVLEVCRETAHTRMPVWDGTPDNVVGVVNTKDLFHLFSLHGVVILMDAMYDPLYVRPTMSVARLLRNFKRVRRPMAVVKGEDGKFLGIVTLEDVLEEIVGEIEDEHDTPDEAESDAAARALSAPAVAPPQRPVAPPRPPARQEPSPASTPPRAERR